MMSDVKVTVLMPAYNAARYLAEAVESILAQSFGGFEFLIVNDGSTDRTEKILADYARRDARIRIISRANTGIVGALNDGLAEARGELIARMDADDVSAPVRLERQVAYMDAHPECEVLGSRVLVTDPCGGVLFTSDHKLNHEEIEAELLDGRGWSLVHPAAMLRRQSVLAIGGYRRQFEYAEDMDLFLRLAETGRLANLPDVLLHYRQHTLSINRTRRQQQIRVIDATVRETYRRRGLPVPENWRYIPRPQLPPDGQLRSWAWKALKDGNVPVARKHALAAWRNAPFNAESWRTLICALRGY